jgi:exodeoxyribonuclease-1
MSFVFYDTETTGTDTWFDQILQFAAIKTDADLNEIERFEIRCRLRPHIVPSPGAMRVTGVRASQLTDVAYASHYEMMRAIRAKLLEWSPATFIGYNSLDFDEPLLRQAFYQTLHSPYLTNMDGNTRSDAMRMVHACNVFAPNCLSIPLGDKGRPVFKLDRLAPANGFNHENAHDALADVEATIFMCRLVQERAPDVWSSFMRFTRKPAVVDYITAEPVFCLSEIYFGRTSSYLVTAIGQNPENGNDWYLYDLAIPPETLAAMTEAQLERRFAVSPKPIRTLRSNGVPIIFPGDEAPASCKAAELGLGELERRAEVLRADDAFRRRLMSAYAAGREPYPESAHVEQQIYSGFFDAEQHVMDAFHEAPWTERATIVERFRDERLKAIGRRLMHAERPDLMDAVLRAEHDSEVAYRLAGESGGTPWLAIPKALADLDEMLAAAAEPEATLLAEHREFLVTRLHNATVQIASQTLERA